MRTVQKRDALDRWDTCIVLLGAKTWKLVIKMEDEAKCSLPKYESLNFLSEQFDPLRALYTPSLQPPIPNIHVFNNIAEYARAIKEGKTKAQPSVPAREAVGPNRRARNLKPEFKQPDIGSRLKAIASQKAEKGHVAVDSGVKPPLIGYQTAEKTLGFGTEQKWKKKYKNVLERMDECVSGPFSILYKCLKERYKVQVWIRKYKGLRSVLTGFVIAFDKHMNLALMDVDELYTVEERVERLPSEESKTTKKKKKKKRKKKKNACEMTEQQMDVGKDKENNPSMETKSKSLISTCPDSVSFLRQKMSSASSTLTSDNVTTSETLDLLSSRKNIQEQSIEAKGTNQEESLCQFSPQKDQQTSDKSANTTSSPTSLLSLSKQEAEDQKQAKTTPNDNQNDPANPSYLFSQDLTVRVPANDDDVSRDMEFTVVGIFQPKSTQESGGDGDSSVELPEFKIPMSFSQHFASTSTPPFEKTEGINSSKDVHSDSKRISNLRVSSSLASSSGTDNAPNELNEGKRDSVEDLSFVDRMSCGISGHQQWEPPLSFRDGAGIESSSSQDIAVEHTDFSSENLGLDEGNANTGAISESQTLEVEMETIGHNIEETCEEKLDVLMAQSEIQSSKIKLAQLETRIGLGGISERTIEPEVIPMEIRFEECSSATEHEIDNVTEAQRNGEKSNDQLLSTSALDYLTDDNADIVTKIQSDTLDCVTKEESVLDGMNHVTEDKLNIVTNEQLDTLDYVTDDNVNIVTKVQSDTPDDVTKEETVLDDVSDVTEEKMDVLTNVQLDTLDYVTMEGAVLDNANDDVTEDKFNVETKVQSDSSVLDDVTNVVTTEKSDEEKQLMMKVDMVAKEHVDVTDLDSTLSEVKEDNMNVVIELQSDVPNEVKQLDIAMEDDVKEREVDVKTNAQEKTVIVDVRAQDITQVLCHDVEPVKFETKDDVTEDKINDVTKEKSMEVSKELYCVTDDKVDGVTKERTEKIEQSVGLDDGVSKVESEPMQQSALKDTPDKVAGVTKVQSETIEQSIGSGNVTSHCFKDKSATLSQSEITDNPTAVQLKSENNELVSTIEVLPTGIEKTEMTQQRILEDNVSVVDQEAKSVTSEQLKISDNVAQEEIAVVKVNAVEIVPCLSEIHSGITNRLPSDSNSENCLVPQACEGSRAEDDIKSVMETTLEAEVECEMVKLTKISCETSDGNLQTTQEETGALSKRNIQQDAKESQRKIKEAECEKQNKVDKEEPNGSTTPLPASAITKDKTANIDSEKEEGEITSSDEEGEIVSHQKCSEAKTLNNANTQSKTLSVWDRLGSGKRFSVETSHGRHKVSHDSKKSSEIDRKRKLGKGPSRRELKDEDKRQMRISHSEKTSSDEMMRKGNEIKRRDKIKSHDATERRRRSSIESGKEVKTQQKREAHKEVRKEEKRSHGAQRTAEKSKEKSTQNKPFVNKEKGTTCTTEKVGKVEKEKERHKTQRTVSGKSNEKSPHKSSSTKSERTSTYRLGKEEKGSEREQRKVSGKSSEKSREKSSLEKSSHEKSAKSESTSAGAAKEVIKEEKETHETQIKKSRKSSSGNKSERPSFGTTKNTRKEEIEKHGIQRKNLEKFTENVPREKPAKSERSERKMQQSQRKTGETTSLSMTSTSKKPPSVEKTERRREKVITNVNAPENEGTTADNGLRVDSHDNSREKRQQKNNDNRTFGKTTGKQNIDIKSDKQQKESSGQSGRSSTRRSTEESVRHKDIGSARVSAEQATSQEGGGRQRKGTSASKHFERTIAQKDDKKPEKRHKQEETKREKDVKGKRERQTVQPSQNATSGKDSSFLSRQSSKEVELSDKLSNTKSGNIESRPSRKGETRKSTKNVNDKGDSVSTTSATTTPIHTSNDLSENSSSRMTLNVKTEVKKVGLLPTPVLNPKSKDHSTTFAATRVSEAKDKRGNRNVFSTTMEKRKQASGKKRKFLQESNHERMKKRQKFTQGCSLSRIPLPEKTYSSKPKFQHTETREERKTVEEREGTTKVAASTNRIEIGKGRFLTFKRRHINQLFIRGDNVVMISYAT